MEAVSLGKLVELELVTWWELLRRCPPSPEQEQLQDAPERPPLRMSPDEPFREDSGGLKPKRSSADARDNGHINLT